MPATIERIYTKGTALCVKLLCEEGHSSSWYSQPKMNGIYLGNILTAASVVFGSSTFSQFQSFANVMKLQSMSERSFFALQKKYVYLTINFTYKSYQKCLIYESKSRQNIEVSGDGRCDSSGHNAKILYLFYHGPTHL